MTKLTSFQLEEIYCHIVAGTPISQIAAMYKVSAARIYQLRTNRKRDLKMNDKPVIKRKVIIAKKQTTLDFKVSTPPIKNDWNFCSIM